VKEKETEKEKAGKEIQRQYCKERIKRRQLETLREKQRGRETEVMS
jgi:hypothetical protein